MFCSLLLSVAFSFPCTGKSAITYADKLEVSPLDAGTTNFTIEVEERPVKEQGGSVVMKATEPFCHFYPGRVVNIAPNAHVTVSSKGDTSAGFRPIPGFNQPETLVDGCVNESLNFQFAKREAPPTESDPEWIVLDWSRPVPICGLMVMTGMNEAFPRHDKVFVEAYIGKGDPRIDTAAKSWSTLSGTWSPEPQNERSNFRCWREWVGEKTVKTSALRLRFTGGGWNLREKKCEIPVAGLGEIAVFSPWTKKTAPKKKVAPKGAQIDFEMPFKGKATIQIRDEEGRVVANPVTDIAFDAGEQTASWDLTDINGAPILKPGVYTWRGVAIPPLELQYRYTYYPVGIPSDRRPWLTEDKTGGWLADHDPPRGVVRDGENMWLNAWAEYGDSVICTDLNMKKKWGETRFWVAVPQEICVDNGFVYGYSQAGWNGTDEEIIRIDPRQGYQSRKVFLKKNPPPEDGKKGGFFDVTVSGFQVIGDIAFVSLGVENKICVYDISKGNAAQYRYFTWATVHTQFDEWKPVLIKEISLPSPGRLRRYGDGLLLTTSGADVVTVDTKTYYNVNFNIALMTEM